MNSSAKWLSRYEQFLLKNSAQIGSIESSLRSLSFILPGRFKDVEVASESLYSVLQILGMYHDKIISKAAKAKDPGFRSSSHNRYTEFQTKHNKLYKAISLLVQLTRFTELLWEMVARKKFGEKGRKMSIVVLEAWKAALRLILLVKTRSLSLSPLIPEREVEPDTVDPEAAAAAAASTTNDQVLQSEKWTMPRTKLGLEPTPGIQGVDEYLSNKALTTEDVRSPIELLHKLQDSKAIASEVLYILRPVVYAFLAYKLPRKYKWTPWVVGIVIEYLARRVLLESYKQTIPGGFRGLTKLESEEVAKRGMSMWWWALRGEAYNSITRPLIHGSLNRINRIPGVGLVTGVVEDYLYLLDNYYFSSTSL